MQEELLKLRHEKAELIEALEKRLSEVERQMNKMIAEPRWHQHKEEKDFIESLLTKVKK